MIKFSFALMFICLFTLPARAQEKLRPKIGITLSGGGAKGLAHIGILKAIDSAGLKIDYITGTSMGAIVGALYAVGYSGNDIEKIGREIDWDQLFGNQISFQTLSMEEKEQYSRFAIELPYVNNKIKLQTGVIKGQELNLKFAELFFHVSDVRRFDQFRIPFKCMATDLETGNLVVLDTGNITTALRATMAIPSIFSAVSVGDKKLVDGGVVRNFPVKNVKEMGADIVIGSNVSMGLSAKDKIANPIDVILQMAFFKEASDFKEEKPLTDYYIYQPMEKYNMGSFTSSDAILDDGLETGRAWYPVFKKLADSLNALPAPAVTHTDSIRNHTVFITGYEVTG
ncbi:MAG TPA: patatin-like phospholipase family protein, partial [Ferruginibacter sp.]|nr:patatin-like phospholipase family protein [Ferruginibacter sp.]